MDVFKLAKKAKLDPGLVIAPNDNGENCFCCEAVNRSQTMRKIIGPNLDEKQGLALLRRQTLNKPSLCITANSKLCLNCSTAINGHFNKDITKVLNVAVNPGRSFCIVCRGNSDLVDLSFEDKLKIFMGCGKFVDCRARVCKGHLCKESLLPGFYEVIPSIYRSVTLTPEDSMIWLQSLQTAASKIPAQFYDDETKLNNEEFHTFTGVSKLNFLDMYDKIQAGRFKNNICHKKDLLCFLVKLHQGLSDEFLQVLFRYSSRQQASLAIQTTRKLLMERFVPLHLGLGSISREQFIEKHVPEFHQKLYNSRNSEAAILYIDGTYLDIPKSSNFRVLRQSYSLHKHKHLIKPVMIVGPDGYILDVHGPYFSDSVNNDAAILVKEMQKQRNGLQQWLKEGDIFVVDRGYRDSLEFLEEVGIKTWMPPFLTRGQKQFSDQEANEARLVTKTRWIVESRNGHIKSKFKLFRDKIPIQHLPSIGDFFRIACAIINAYCPTIEMQGANAELAAKLLERAKMPNQLQAYLTQNNIKPNRRWTEYTGVELNTFPKLSMDDLREITLGVYQLKLSKSYVHEKVQREEGFKFQMSLEMPGLLYARLYSRFSKLSKHGTWIKFNEILEPEETSEEEISPIESYYCTCKSGARTVGCCGHVASLLWYLSYARHQTSVPSPQIAALDYILDAPARQHNNIIAPIID